MKTFTFINEAGEISLEAFEKIAPRYKRKYFENAVYCGLCNGQGCKHCDHGIESFWEYNYWHRNEDPIMNGVTYTACVKELAR